MCRALIWRENKKLLHEFDRYCVAEGLSLPRRIKLLEHIYIFGTRYFQRPFCRASPRDILDAVFEIESSSLAPWTKHDYKVAIRKFFKFVAWGNDALRRRDYPDSVAGISTTIKKKDQVRIQASDILTPKEVEQLIAAATDTQDRAFITLIYEVGARISEIGCMDIGSVACDSYSLARRGGLV